MSPAAPPEQRQRATLVGLGAIGLWALLAPLGVLTGDVPPFLLTGIAFAIGGTLGLAVQLLRRRPLAACLRRPARRLAVGASAPSSATTRSTSPPLRLLPPVEALLIINLWPLADRAAVGAAAGRAAAAPSCRWAPCAGLAGTTLIVLARTGGAEAVAAARSATPAPSPAR